MLYGWYREAGGITKWSELSHLEGVHWNDENATSATFAVECKYGECGNYSGSVKVKVEIFG